MMDLAIVKMSSKGQLVLPSSMRKAFKLSNGNHLLLARRGGTILLRPIGATPEDEEIFLANLANDGWGDINKGKSRKLSKEGFLRELEKW